MGQKTGKFFILALVFCCIIFAATDVVRQKKSTRRL